MAPTSGGPRRGALRPLAGMPRPAVGRTGQLGMVTAEAAFAVAAILAATLVLVAGLQVVALSVWANDAARETARVLARGDGLPQARALLGAERPDAVLRVRRADGLVEVRVRVPVGPVGRLPFLPHSVDGRASTLDEGIQHQVVQP